MVNGWSVIRRLLRMANSCILCGGDRQGEGSLCRGCRSDLGSAEPACRRCAVALPVKGLCPECQRRPPPFDAAWAAVPYQTLSRELVHQLKYQGRLGAATVLGELLAERLRRRGGPWPDLIVPVPLHPRRLRNRGFNQATEVARVLSKQIGTAVELSLCQRVRNTVPQTRIVGAGERRRNLESAFRTRKELGGLDAAIVDDVVTTGATVRELAREMKRAGAGRVEVWCACRASL